MKKVAKILTITTASVLSVAAIGAITAILIHRRNQRYLVNLNKIVNQTNPILKNKDNLNKKASELKEEDIAFENNEKFQGEVRKLEFNDYDGILKVTYRLVYKVGFKTLISQSIVKQIVGFKTLPQIEKDEIDKEKATIKESLDKEIESSTISLKDTIDKAKTLPKKINYSDIEFSKTNNKDFLYRLKEIVANDKTGTLAVSYYLIYYYKKTDQFIESKVITKTILGFNTYGNILSSELKKVTMQLNIANEEKTKNLASSFLTKNNLATFSNYDHTKFELITHYSHDDILGKLVVKYHLKSLEFDEQSEEIIKEYDGFLTYKQFLISKTKGRLNTYQNSLKNLQIKKDQNQSSLLPSQVTKEMFETTYDNNISLEITNISKQNDPEGTVDVTFRLKTKIKELNDKEVTSEEKTVTLNNFQNTNATSEPDFQTVKSELDNLAKTKVTFDVRNVDKAVTLPSKVTDENIKETLNGIDNSTYTLHKSFQKNDALGTIDIIYYLSKMHNGKKIFSSQFVMTINGFSNLENHLFNEEKARINQLVSDQSNLNFSNFENKENSLPSELKNNKLMLDKNKSLLKDLKLEYEIDANDDEGKLTLKYWFVSQKFENLKSDVQMKTYSLMNAKTRELNNKINNLVPKIKQSVKAYDLKSFKKLFIEKIKLKEVIDKNKLLDLLDLGVDKSQIEITDLNTIKVYEENNSYFMKIKLRFIDRSNKSIEKEIIFDLSKHLWTNFIETWQNNISVNKKESELEKYEQTFAKDMDHKLANQMIEFNNLDNQINELKNKFTLKNQFVSYEYVFSSKDNENGKVTFKIKYVVKYGDNVLTGETKEYTLVGFRTEQSYKLYQQDLKKETERLERVFQNMNDPKINDKNMFPSDVTDSMFTWSGEGFDINTEKPVVENKEFDDNKGRLNVTWHLSSANMRLKSARSESKTNPILYFWKTESKIDSKLEELSKVFIEKYKKRVDELMLSSKDKFLPVIRDKATSKIKEFLLGEMLTKIVKTAKQSTKPYYSVFGIDNPKVDEVFESHLNLAFTRLNDLMHLYIACINWGYEHRKDDTGSIGFWLYITQHVVRYNNIGPFVTNTFKYFGSTVHELVDNLVKEKIENDEKLKEIKEKLSENTLKTTNFAAKYLSEMPWDWVFNGDDVVGKPKFTVQDDLKNDSDARGGYIWLIFRNGWWKIFNTDKYRKKLSNLVSSDSTLSDSQKKNIIEQGKKLLAPVLRTIDVYSEFIKNEILYNVVKIASDVAKAV